MSPTVGWSGQGCPSAYPKSGPAECGSSRGMPDTGDWSLLVALVTRFR